LHHQCIHTLSNNSAFRHTVIGEVAPMTAISVIIPAYNGENTLEACVDSIFANQFFSLECLLVDDGSTDSTLELCKRLAIRYPSVKVFTKQNSGPADARNLGLENATGTFITFVDADDTIPSNALRRMYETALETDSDIIMGNHLRKDNLGRLSESAYFKRWLQCRSNLSLADEPEALLSIHAWGKLYKSSFLKKNALTFPPGERWGEDMVFTYKALTSTENFSFISTVVYYYHLRKRHEQNLTNHATLPTIRTIVRLLTYTQEIFRNCDTPLYRKIRGGRIKHSLAYHCLQNIIRNNNSESFHELQSIVKSVLTQIEPTSVTSDIRLNTVLDEIASAKSYRLLRTRLFIRHYTYQIMRFALIRLPSLASMLKKYFARLLAVAHPATVTWLFKAGLAHLIVKANYKTLKPVWLIGEREGKSINDNGYAFFSYLVENQTDIHPIFVIRPKLRPKVPEELLRNTVQQGSLRHLIYCRIAEVCVYTHTAREILSHPIFPQLSPYIQLSGLKVFLGHGVSAIHNVPFYSFSNMNARREAPDVFIASSAKERDIIINQLEHAPERVAITGMPRLDALHRDRRHFSPRKERILFIPTWRQCMERNSSPLFMTSQFFLSIRDLLASDRLMQLLEENNFVVDWVVHHQFEKHFKTLSPLLNSRVILQRMVAADFQELLRNSSVLITDYSSISFDMASIKKPVIYFQFDQEDFLKARNGTSLNYEKDLPGPVLRTAEEVVQELEELTLNGFTQKKIYQERTKAFITHAGSNNSRRVYEAIQTRLSKRAR
jgi:glycosyltransferase involved in cell wall biosynthesis